MSVHYNEGFKREVAIAYMAGQKQQLILLLNIIFLKPLFESGLRNMVKNANIKIPHYKKTELMWLRK